ncbi:MAG TPA: hypothetical protein DDY18_09055 [Flavobacterium sp.]|nr:hypothetical protein [Flavobacterium sp.]
MKTVLVKRYQCSVCDYASDNEQSVVDHESKHTCIHPNIHAKLEIQELPGDTPNGGYDHYLFSVIRECKDCYKTVEESSMMVTGFNNSDFVDELEQLVKKHGRTWRPEVVK